MRPQRFAFDVFGGDEMDSARPADFVNGDNVGMVERARGLRLADKAAQPKRVVGIPFRQELQRDTAVKLRVIRQINFTHPACTDSRDDFITPKFRSCLNHRDLFAGPFLYGNDRFITASPSLFGWLLLASIPRLLDGIGFDFRRLVFDLVDRNNETISALGNCFDILPAVMPFAKNFAE